ncbi:MAG TPA: PEP-CTERM sorting domain-containing protein [Pirellulales bacterium]|nr:PEP-CTERM sorting domain-containing protein [Pirellulales bacterium]
MISAGGFCSTAYPQNITINASQLVTNSINGQQVVATVSPIGIGMNTSVYYNNMNAPYISSALDAGGVSIIRYPGGNYSDIYHWTNNVATGGYTNSNSNFGVWATNLINSPTGLAKQAMVTIDYGSSLNSTMGGQPQEAAAWVAYANATVNGANATMQLGTDAEGNNWGTVRYWAALRAANPNDANWATDGSVGVVLNASDMPSMTPGNFLKNKRAAPIGVQYWEIGNEINGNGYFSGLNWQNDLHYAGTGADRVGQPNLSPTFYGQQIPLFASAMEAVDPTIKIGGVLDNASNYDPYVLQGAASSMNFGIVHYYPNLSGTGNTTVRNFLAARVTDIPNFINSSRSLISTNAGADAAHIPVFITEFGNLGSTLPGTTQGLQTAIDYAGFLKAGVQNTDMWEMTAGYLVDQPGTLSKGVSYYAMEALYDFIRPGDTFISASSSSNTAGIVYAAKRADGTISIMLINPSTNAANMAVSISGEDILASGTLFSTSLTSDPTQSTVTGLGNSFTAAVAGRSISVYDLSPFVVPEPATAILFGIGIAALGLFRMRRGSGGALS